MPALDAGIQAVTLTGSAGRMDGRVKPGHNDALDT